MGYCPFFKFGSRYNRLYRDTVQLGRIVEGHDTASNPATQPRGPTTWPACAQGERQRERAWPGL